MFNPSSATSCTGEGLASVVVVSAIVVVDEDDEDDDVATTEATACISLLVSC